MTAAEVSRQPARVDAWGVVERETYGEAPEPAAPRYVHGCYHCRNSLLLWDKAAQPGPSGIAARRVAARCGSWRHPGPCQRKAARQDFARICAAFKPYRPADLVFFVLTLDRNGTCGGRSYETRAEAFAALAGAWTRLLKRIDYHLAKHGEEPIGNRWAMVVEQHRSGWPHVNVMCVCPALARFVAERKKIRRAAGRTKRQSILVEDHSFLECGDGCRCRRRNAWSLRRAIVGAGFGVQSSAERVDSREALAGYFAGLSDEALDLGEDGDEYKARVAAEVSKIIQTPTAAPPGFRRLRSGVRFLPPRVRAGGGTMTGVMVNAEGRIVTRQRRGATRPARVPKARGAARCPTIPVWERWAVDVLGDRIYPTTGPPPELKRAAYKGAPLGFRDRTGAVWLVVGATVEGPIVMRRSTWEGRALWG